MIYPSKAAAIMGALEEEIGRLRADIGLLAAAKRAVLLMRDGEERSGCIDICIEDLQDAIAKAEENAP